MSLTSMFLTSRESSANPWNDIPLWLTTSCISAAYTTNFKGPIEMCFAAGHSRGPQLRITPLQSLPGRIVLTNKFCANWAQRRWFQIWFGGRPAVLYVQQCQTSSSSSAAFSQLILSHLSLSKPCIHSFRQNWCCTYNMAKTWHDRNKHHIAWSSEHEYITVVYQFWILFKQDTRTFYYGTLKCGCNLYWLLQGCVIHSKFLAKLECYTMAYVVIYYSGFKVFLSARSQALKV